MGDTDRKRALGAFYTQGNPFVFGAFKGWMATIPAGTTYLEPFAGSKQIPRLLTDAGFDLPFVCYDVDRAVGGVRHADTLLHFPRGFAATITNPPYLSRNFAARRGMPISEDHFRGYASLYQSAVDRALAECGHVAMIIPESFLTTGLFRGRLRAVISLPFQMFDDTEMPVCLALWGPGPTGDFVVWRQNERLGAFAELAAALTPTHLAADIRFNVPHGALGLWAVDDTRTASIRFCRGDLIDPSRVKHSSRHVTRIGIPGHCDVDELAGRANALLADWRASTHDVMLTAFKGLRADGHFRRRLDFANARAILSHAM